MIQRYFWESELFLYHNIYRSSLVLNPATPEMLQLPNPIIKKNIVCGVPQISAEKNGERL